IGCGTESQGQVLPIPSPRKVVRNVARASSRFQSGFPKAFLTPNLDPQNGTLDHARDAPLLLSPNKSLLRAGGQWHLVCKSLAGIDKVPMISLCEPPGAELNR